MNLGRGDIVLLFTDGITEAMIGGRRLGTDGLAAVFRKLAEGGSDHGGCSSCSSGSANELANYFAGLRAQMEQHQRVPLV